MDEAILLNQLENVEAAEELVSDPERDFWSKSRKDSFEGLNDRQFVKMFRLTKELVLNIVDELDEFLDPPTRLSAIPKKIKVLIALKFYACGSYQSNVGLNKYMAVSQSTVSRCITEVTNALNNPRIFNNWVKFSMDMEHLNVMRKKFYEAYGIPGIIGVIDCTHLAIFPPAQNEHIYVNRKQYHSVNTQLICDINLKILNVNGRYPGSTHDAFIWRNSNINQHLEELSRNNPNYYLIGDSGYPLRTWIQVLIPNAQPGSAEENYNKEFCRARCLIERCNGLLKMRFRCLLKHRVLHYSPTMAGKIINACCILHMSIANNISEPETEDEDELLDLGIFKNMEPADDAVRNPDLEAGRRLQKQIIQNYFRI